jgi:hypothetical protein
VTVAGWPDPDLIDVFRRRVAAVEEEWENGSRRWLRRDETGVAERRRRGGSSEQILARSETADPGGDADGGPAAEAVLRPPPPTVRVSLQRASLDTTLVTARGFRGRHRQELSTLVVSAPAATGLLSRVRLAPWLGPEEVAAEVEAVLAARSLAERARTVARPRRLRLLAPVAARLLACLWWAGGDAPVTATAAELADDATESGGPLGAPFDGDGRATRRVALAGPAAEGRAALGTLRPSFADPPRRWPRNLRLDPRDDLPVAAADLVAVEVEQAIAAGAGRVRFHLLGLLPGRAAARTEVELDLALLLEAVVAGGAGHWWTAAGGAVGSPELLLELP